MRNSDRPATMITRTTRQGVVGMARDSVAQSSVAQDSMAQRGVARPSVAQDARAQDGLAQDSVAQRGVAEESVAQGGVAPDGEAQPPGTVTALRRPPVRQSVLVRSDRQHTFDTFVRTIGAWWPVTPFSAGKDQARAVTLDGRQGGRVSGPLPAQPASSLGSVYRH